MNSKVRQHLIEMSEEDYKKFSSSLTPNCGVMLGVRLPMLRKYAAQILIKSDAISALGGEDIYFEEIMLRGMIIGGLDTDIPTKLKYISDFVPLINNWSVCDSFCASLKFTNENKNTVWEFLQTYFSSEKEFYARFGAVMILNYFIDDEYIDKSLEVLRNIPTNSFYSSMGTAWAVCVCYAKFPQKTKKFLEDNVLDDKTYNRSIRKICESYRVEQSEKDYLKTKIRKKGKNDDKRNR